MHAKCQAAFSLAFDGCPLCATNFRRVPPATGNDGTVVARVNFQPENPHGIHVNLVLNNHNFAQRRIRERRPREEYDTAMEYYVARAEVMLSFDSKSLQITCNSSKNRSQQDDSDSRNEVTGEEHETD